MKNLEVLNEWIREALKSNNEEKKELAVAIVDRVLPDLIKNGTGAGERLTA